MLKERCRNSWKLKPCMNMDVAVYIMLQGVVLPVCGSCWNRIAASRREWSNGE